MPSAYAHRLFGRRVLQALPEGGARTLICRHADLFEIGLQGPDILFFYHPLSHAPLNRLGYRIHDESCTSFLEREACRQAREGALAYLLGLICHFTLDSECHTLVEYYIERTGRGHSQVETELDRFLMVRDGLNALRTNPSAYIRDTRANAAVIAQFYGAKVGQVRQALTTMKAVGWALTPSNRGKYALLRRVGRMMGEGSIVTGLTMDWTPDPVYRDSNEALTRRLEQAVPTAVALMDDFLAWQGGESPLSRRFRPTFSYDPEELARRKEQDHRDQIDKRRT